MRFALKIALMFMDQKTDDNNANYSVILINVFIRAGITVRESLRVVST